MSISLARIMLAAEDGAVSSDACMIYLAVPAGVLPAGYPQVQPAHVTVTYLGHVTPAQFEVACQRVQAAARAFPPLHGQLGGLGYFMPSVSSGGKRVAYVPVIADGAYQLNQMLSDLAAPEAHPFRPHVTLAYLGPDDPAPPPATSASLWFKQLFIRRGTDTRSYAFQGHHLPHPYGGRREAPLNAGAAPLTALSRVLAAADDRSGVGLTLQVPRSASGS